MTILHPVVNAIAERTQRISKALREGSLLPSDGAYLSSNYAYLYKDGPTPLLGMGYAGGAEPDSYSEDHIWFTTSTYDEDRDGDLVVPQGRLGENYARNPIWLFGHGQWELPIGTSRAPDGRIMVVVEDNRIRQAWYPDVKDEDAMRVADKVRRGVINGTSIAFVPIEAYRRDQERKDLDKARTHSSPLMPAGWLFKSWDHTETSIVPVGSNPNAVAEIRHALRDIYDKEHRDMKPRFAKAWMSYCAVEKGRAMTGPHKDNGLVEKGCVFDGRSWWCPVPEKEVRGGVVVKKSEVDKKFLPVPEKAVAKSCCSSCEQGKPCGCKSEKNEKQWGLIYSVKLDKGGKFYLYNDRERKVVDGPFKSRADAEARAAAFKSAKNQGEVRHDEVGLSGAKHSKDFIPPAKSSQADVESPVNDVLDKYGKVKIPKQLGSLKLRECVKQRIKDGVKYDDAVKFCSGLMDEFQPKQPPPRMRRGLQSKASDPYESYSPRLPWKKVGEDYYYTDAARQVWKIEYDNYEDSGGKRYIIRGPAKSPGWAQYPASNYLATQFRAAEHYIKLRAEELRRGGMKSMSNCRRCKGTGLVANTGSSLGSSAQGKGQRTCPRCKGWGDWLEKLRQKVEELGSTLDRALQHGNELRDYFQRGMNPDTAAILLIRQFGKGRAPVIQKPIKKGPQSAVRINRQPHTGNDNSDENWNGPGWYIVDDDEGIISGPYSSQQEAEDRGYKSLKAASDFKRPGTAKLTAQEEDAKIGTGAGVQGRGLTETSGTAGGYVTQTAVGGTEADSEVESDPKQDTEASPGYIRCDDCQGTGNCANCGGVGQIGDRTPISRAKPDTIKDCKVCGGTGHCTTCDGSGSVKKIPQVLTGRFPQGNPTPTGAASTAQARGKKLNSKTEKNMATKTKGKKRKASVDEPFDPAPSSGGEGAGDDRALDVTKDPIEDAFTPQPTAKRMAMLYRQLAANSDWLQKEIAGMDALDGGKDILQKFHDDWNAPAMEALAKALTDNYPDHDMDKCMKALESDGAGPTDPTGEASLVDAGQVPPDTVAAGVDPEAMPFAGEQTPEEEYLEGEGASGEHVPFGDKDLTDMGNLDELKDLCPGCGEDAPSGANFCPSCGGAMTDGDGKAIGGYDSSNPDTTDADKLGKDAAPPGSDPDTEEILQRYQTPKGWMVRRGLIRYAEDGTVRFVKWLGAGVAEKDLTDPGNPAEMSGQPPVGGGPGRGEIIVGSGQLKDVGGIADGLDEISGGMSGVQQAAMRNYSASLRKLVKDLTEGGKVEGAEGGPAHEGGSGGEMSQPDALAGVPKDSTGTGDSVDEGQAPFQGQDKDSTGTGDSVDEGQAPYQGQKKEAKSLDDVFAELEESDKKLASMAKSRGINFAALGTNNGNGAGK